MRGKPLSGAAWVGGVAGMVISVMIKLTFSFSGGAWVGGVEEFRSEYRHL